MRDYTNRNAKRLFTTIYCLCFAFVAVIQFYSWLAGGAFNLILLVVSLLFSAGVIVCLRLYFAKQRHMLDDATAQIDRFASGDTGARIACYEEGDFARLFHAVNKLTTTLSANAEHEQQEKEFLKDAISDISHQLKTPLAALEIFNSILRDESENPASVSEFSAKSEKEIERIETLVKSLLKITRLDSGSIVMNRHPENVSDMMNETSSHFDTRAKIEHKRLILSGPDDAMLLCDKIWLMEAVGNLIKNALDHTQADGLIEVQWRALPTAIQIRVKDDGCGIHPEDIFHIFKRFYRSRFGKDTEGIGLGLPLVKAITQAHGGTVEVDSVLGHGSTFTLSFPRLTEL